MFEVTHLRQESWISWHLLLLFMVSLENMIVIYSQVARKRVCALIFRIFVFELVLFCVVDGLVVLDRIELLVGHGTTISRAILRGHG